MRLRRVARERVHEIRLALRVPQADRQVIEGDGRLRLVGEGLEHVGGNGRAGQRDQELGYAAEPIREGHVAGPSSQWAVTSAASAIPPGMVSTGPTTVRWRITPALSTT